MQPVSRRDYVKIYYPYIKQITEGTGILPATQISQAIVESSGKIGKVWLVGGSSLAKDYNNLHGIKAGKSWKGKIVNLKTREVFNGKDVTITDAFRVYDNEKQSMADHVNFLLTNPRYEKAGVFKAKTVKQQAEALQKAGYATDPNYSKTLANVGDQVEKYIFELFGDQTPKDGQTPTTDPQIILAKGNNFLTIVLLIAAAYALFKTIKQ